MSANVVYDDKDTTEERIAKCITFELSHGGNEHAAAKAILRDIALGWIVLPSSENARLTSELDEALAREKAYKECCVSLRHHVDDLLHERRTERGKSDYC